MAKLTRSKTFRSVIGALIFLLLPISAQPSAALQNTAEIYDEVYRGKFIKLASEIPNLVNRFDAASLWVSEHERAEVLYFLGHRANLFELHEVSNFILEQLTLQGSKSKSNASQLARIWSLALKLQSKNASPAERKAAYNELAKADVTHVLYGVSRLDLRLRLIDYFVSLGDFDRAEEQIFIAYGVAANASNPDPQIIFALHARAAFVFGKQGRGSAAFNIVDQAYRLNTERIIAWQDPEIIASAAILALGMALSGREDLSAGIFNAIERFRIDGIPVPSNAWWISFINYHVLAAYNGVAPAKKWLQSVAQENNNLTMLLTLLAKANSPKEELQGGIITSSEFDLAQSIPDGSVDEIQIMKGLLEFQFFAQKLDNRQFWESFDRYFARQLDNRSKRENFLSSERRSSDRSNFGKKLFYRNLLRVEPLGVSGERANKIALLAFEGASKIDRIAEFESKEFGLNEIEITLARNYLQRNFELESLVFKMAEMASTRSIEYATNDFKPLKTGEIRSAFSIIREVQKQKLFHHSLKKMLPANALGTGYRPFDLSDLQKGLKPQEAILLLDSIGEYALSCFIKLQKISCRTDEVRNGDSVESLVKSLRSDITESDKTLPFPSNNAEALFDTFFKAGDFDGIQRIYLHPASHLTHLPINVLRSSRWNKDSYLGLRLEINLLPTLRRFGKAEKKSEPESYLGIGNPNFQETAKLAYSKSSSFSIRSAALASEINELSSLPDTEQEINASALNFQNGSKLTLLKEDATELNFRMVDLEKFDVLHFATHGLVSGEFNSSNLKLPSLALSLEPKSTSSLTDGLLTSAEIAELQLSGQVVILSACRTFSDEGAYNPGFTGLTASFLFAGAKSILATQWQIESKSAAKFVSDLIRSVKTDGKELAAAIREQSRNFAATEQYSHPFYWAPFVGVTSIRPQDMLETKKERVNVISYLNSDGKIEIGQHALNLGNTVAFTFWEKNFDQAEAKNYFGQFNGKEVLRDELELGSARIIGRTGSKVHLHGTIKKNGIRVIAFASFDVKARQLTINKELNFFDKEIQITRRLIHHKDSWFGLFDVFDDDKGRGAQTIFAKFDKNMKVTFQQNVKNIIAGNYAGAVDMFLSNGALHLTYQKWDQSALGRTSFETGSDQYCELSSVFVDIFNPSNNKFSFVGKYRGINYGNTRLETDVGSYPIFYDLCNHSNFVLGPAIEGLEWIESWPHKIKRIQKILHNSSTYFLIDSDLDVSMLEGFIEKTPISTIGWMNDRQYTFADNHAYIQTLVELKAGNIQILNNRFSRLLAFSSFFAANDNELWVAGTRQRDTAYIDKVAISK